MSGIIGHVTYALLGAQAATARRLPVAPLLRRHWASYLCGAYLGCDIQTLPEAVCVDTGREVGPKQLDLNWPDLLADLAAAPVESLQPHTMRLGEARGDLGRYYPEGWKPALAPLLSVVMAENRRYLRLLIPGWLKELELQRTEHGLDCSETIRATSGLHYAEMVALADKANFRHALWQIGEAVAEVFADVVQLQPTLQDLPVDAPPWDELTRRWRRKEQP